MSSWRQHFRAHRSFAMLVQQGHSSFTNPMSRYLSRLKRMTEWKRMRKSNSSPQPRLPLEVAASHQLADSSSRPLTHMTTLAREVPPSIFARAADVRAAATGDDTDNKVRGISVE